MTKKFLGIDYGAKRVGLAISDEMGRLAFPFKILKNDANLFSAIWNICNEKGIEEIVLGESLDFSGKENLIMEEIKKFKNEIMIFGLPIHLEKEFFTSFEARPKKGKKINNARKTKKSISKKIDASAAALILQRYLDKKNKKSLC